MHQERQRSDVVRQRDRAANRTLHCETSSLGMISIHRLEQARTHEPQINEVTFALPPAFVQTRGRTPPFEHADKEVLPRI